MISSDRLTLLQISEEIRNAAQKHEDEARRLTPSGSHEKHGIIAETLYIVADAIKNRVEAREK